MEAQPERTPRTADGHGVNYDPLSELYELQYRHYRDDFPFYTRLADDYGAPVLELGVGSARVSTALARAGHQVVGIELSSDMLARGRVRVRQEGLTERVALLQGDMRTVRLDASFPVVIAPFNTLMHAYTLAEQDATLATVRAHLEPGGIFALDLYNPNFNELNVLRREAEWDHVGGEEGDLFLYQTHEPDTQLLHTRYYLDRLGENGVLTRQVLTLTQRYYTRFELERALLQAGFQHLQFFGGFDRQRYSNRSGHLICLAR